VEYETPHWAGSVDAVRKAFEVDAALPEFVHQQYQIPHAAPEAIQLPHYQRIALTQRSKKLLSAGRFATVPLIFSSKICSHPARSSACR
jgi:hypothetical protein